MTIVSTSRCASLPATVAAAASPAAGAQARGLCGRRTKATAGAPRRRLPLACQAGKEGSEAREEPQGLGRSERGCSPSLTGRREALWSLAAPAAAAAAAGSGARLDSPSAAAVAPATVESEGVLQKSFQGLRNEGLQVEGLRQSSEAAAKDELQKKRVELEQEAKASQEGKFCATPFGFDFVGITRKRELEEVNAKLRVINLKLREQARSGITYAPGLVYAPRISSDAPATTTVPTQPPSPPAPQDQQQQVSAGMASVQDNEASATAIADRMTSDIVPEQQPAEAEGVEEVVVAQGPYCDLTEVSQQLRKGKRLLKSESTAAEAMIYFEKALMYTRMQKDKIQERRAIRGLAAAKRLLREPRDAIRLLLEVLMISREIGDTNGDTDAMGTLADLYTEIGDFEEAAKWYDRYISDLGSEN